jgi:hypothetical protein
MADLDLTAEERAEAAWLRLRVDAAGRDAADFGWPWVETQLRAQAETALFQGDADLNAALLAKAEEAKGRCDAPAA